MNSDAAEQFILGFFLAVGGLVVLAHAVAAICDGIARRGTGRRRNERPTTPDEETPPEEWP